MLTLIVWKSESTLTWKTALSSRSGYGHKFCQVQDHFSLNYAACPSFVRKYILTVCVCILSWSRNFCLDSHLHIISYHACNLEYWPIPMHKLWASQSLMERFLVRSASACFSLRLSLTFVFFEKFTLNPTVIFGHIFLYVSRVHFSLFYVVLRVYYCNLYLYYHQT